MFNMNKNIFSLAVIILFSCGNHSEPNYLPAQVETLDAQEVTDITAVCKERITEKGTGTILEYGIELNDGSGYVKHQRNISASGSDFGVSFTELSPDKAYRYRAYVNDGTVQYGTEKNFTTLEAIAFTATIESKTMTTVTILFNLTDRLKEWGVYYSEKEATVNDQVIKETIHDEVMLTDLKPNTTYYILPYVTDKSNKTTFLGKKSFTTAKGFDFTSEDATAAIDAFNHYFFNKTNQLYYTTSNKKGIAAIWTQAIYWDMLMNAYKRTKEQKYWDLMYDFYEGGYNHYDKYNWDNGPVWFIYDDIMWWVISFARAYELTGDQKFLVHSETGFERVWSGSKVVGDNGSYDAERGGMYWAWDSQNPVGSPARTMGKMACINYPTVIAAMTLYNVTKNKDYLMKANEMYDWARNNLFDQQMGAVADSKHGEGTPNWTMHVYNQATCIGEAVLLYKETQNQQFLQDAILAADYTKNKMSEEKGILSFENGIEQGIYTAIFSQYIIRLIEDGGQSQYIEWMRYNANNAWANRDWRDLTYKDFNIACPSGIIEVYDASAGPALMQVIPPKEKNN